MAPIFTPDGTEVEEVILPDGSEAFEVIAPDGTVVFEGIPDSDHQWLWDEGQGESLVDNIGDADATREGATWSEDTNAVGGWWLEFDGSDNYVDLPIIDELDGGQFSIAITVYTDTINQDGFIWNQTDDNRFSIALDDASIQCEGVNSDSFGGSWSNPPESTLFRLGVAFDFTNGDVEIYRDGDRVDDGTDAPGTGSATAHEIGRTIGGGNEFEGVLDHPVAAYELWDSNDFTGDYGEQPWS